MSFGFDVRDQLNTTGGGGGGTQSNTLGMSNLGNTAGTSGVISGNQLQYLFAGGSNVTLSQSINGNSATLSFIAGATASQSVQTQNLVALSLSGNTSGALALMSSGTVILAGGNNITLSQNGQSVTISGPNAAGAQTGISGIVVSDTTYTSGTVSFSNQNNITIGSSVDGATQYIRLSVGNYLTTAMASNRGSDFVQATAAFAGTSASGTIASDGISVSIGPYITTAMQSNAATISNIRVSAGTTSNLLSRLTFADSNGVSFGLDASTITATVKTDYLTAQTNQTVGLYASSNTYLTSSGTVDARSLSFRGDKSITVGISAGEVAFSVGAYLTTAMASNRGSDFVAATAAFAGTSASGTIASNGISVSIGPYITTAALSGDTSKYVQNWKLTGNTAGTTSSAQGTDLWFSGGNSITVSGNSNTVVFSVGNYITTAALSGDTSKYVQAWELTGNTAGTTSSAQGTKLYFEGGNSITVSGNSNTIKLSVGNYLTTAMASGDSTKFVQANATFNGTNATGTIASNAISVSVAAPIPIATAVNAVASANSTGTVTRYAPEDHRHAGVGAVGISTSGNTAGTTGSEQGTYWFQGGNSITVSQITSNNGSHTLVISAGNYITTAALSGDTSKYVQAWELTGNTAGTTSSAQGTKIYFEGGNSITVSGNSNTIKLSVGAYLTTADLSANSSKYVQNWKLTGNTAGTTSSAQGTDLWFDGGNSITVSGNSNTIKFSVGAYLTTAALSGDTSKYVQNWKLTGNTAGTTSSAQGTDLWFSGGNSITVSGNSNSIVFSVGAYITTAALSGDTSKYVQAWELTGNTAGTTSSAQGTKIYFEGGANVTISGNSNTIKISAASAAAAPVNFSAGTTSGNLGSVVFSNSNGISFGLNGSTITANATRGFYATGNTTDNTSATFDLRSLTVNAQNASGCLTVGFSNGSMELSGASTVGTATTYYSVASANSVGTVTRWAAEDHRHAGVGGIGISTGNTLGTTGSVLGTYWIVGSNAISVSQITSNNGSHTLNVVGPPHLSYYPFLPLGVLGANTLTTSVGQSTSSMMPFVLPWNHSFDRMRLIASGSVAASSTQATTGNTSLSMTAVTSHNLVIYSRGAGASSLSLQYVTSTQIVDQVSLRISYAANSTQFSFSLRYSLGSDSFTKDYSQSTNSIQYATSHLTDLTGLKVLDIPFGISLAPGNYWLGYGRSTTTQTQANSISVGTRLAVSHNSMLGISQNTLGVMGMLGAGSASSVGWYPAFGSYTTSGAAGTTSSVEMSAVSTHTSHAMIHAQFMRIV